MSAFSPSPIPTRFNKARAASTTPIQQAIEGLRLPPIRARKLNGILNALIMQIEDGGDHPDVNRLLFEALRKNLVHQVGEKAAKPAFAAIVQFERAEAVYWKAVSSGNPPLIELTDEERLDNLMQEGYSLILAHDQLAGCDRWLAAWELAKTLHTPKMTTASDFDAAYPNLTQFFTNWAYDLEMELGNAGIDEPGYHKRRIQYTEEFLSLFPDSDTDVFVNFKRAQGEALWGLGNHSEAEAVYESLVKQLPDEAWGYIGWSDQYWMFGSVGEPQYEKAEAILRRALARPLLRQDADVLDRLRLLYEEWGKSAEHDAVVRQLEQIKRNPRPVQDKTGPLPPFHSSPNPIKRNDLCWCGSGKKYKKCHGRKGRE